MNFRVARVARRASALLGAILMAATTIVRAGPDVTGLVAGFTLAIDSAAHGIDA